MLKKKKKQKNFLFFSKFFCNFAFQFGLLAQLGLERFLDAEEVTGSNPVEPTRLSTQL